MNLAEQIASVEQRVAGADQRVGAFLCRRSQGAAACRARAARPASADACPSKTDRRRADQFRLEQLQHRFMTYAADVGADAARAGGGQGVGSVRPAVHAAARPRAACKRRHGHARP